MIRLKIRHARPDVASAALGKAVMEADAAVAQVTVVTVAATTITTFWTFDTLFLSEINSQLYTYESKL